MSILVTNMCFGHVPNECVLNEVSFTIEKGQFFGIIGPNGGGKSTLLKLILGLFNPWSGTITVNGQTPPTVDVAYVPQTFPCDRSFPITVLEVVLGGRARYLSSLGRFSKADREAAHQALESVGLTHICNQAFGSLSSGQAQRVLIARALASSPSILLLDEPTSSADPDAEAAILSIINSLKGTITVLMVTHSLEAILEMVEGILCIQGGAILMQPKDVCEHFALGLYHVPLAQTPHNHFSYDNP